MIGLLLLIGIASAVDAGASGPEVQVSTIDGRVVNDHLLTTGQILSGFASGTVSVDEVLGVTPVGPSEVPTEKPTAWIELIDGSKFTTTEFSIDGKVAHFSYGKGERDEIFAASICKVRFSPPGASEWPKNVGADAKGDLLAVHKKDQLDFMEGTIGNVDDNYVILKVDGENYPVKRSKVDGLIFFQQERPKVEDPFCVVETTTGDRIRAKTLIMYPPINKYPEGLTVAKTYCDASIPVAWQYVTKLDFSAGKVDYLSDLEPVSMQWTPYLDLGDAVPAMAEFYAPRRDEGREHQPLRLAGKEYDKGLSLYPRTAIEYRVPPGMKKFKAVAGIDEAVRETGKARLAISADGKTLFDRAIRGKDAPVDLDVDISGAKWLSILVDYGDQFDAGDFLDLADARMVK